MYLADSWGLNQFGSRSHSFAVRPAPKLILALKIASAGAVRVNPAEAFAKGGNSDEHQESILSSVLSLL